MNEDYLDSGYELSKEEKDWGVILHVSPLCAFLGIPFGHILAPLIIWFLKRDESEFLNQQGKEVINFQISFTIYLIVAALLCFVLIGFLVVPALIIGEIVLIIMAAKQVSSGEEYEYPYIIRLIN